MSVVKKRLLRAVTNIFNDIWNWPPYRVNCKKFKEIIFYSIIAKKNNQSSVSDADQEIPNLWSTDNARFLPSFLHYQLTHGLGFLGLHRRLMIDCICPNIYNFYRNNVYISLTLPLLL